MRFINRDSGLSLSSESGETISISQSSFDSSQVRATQAQTPVNSGNVALRSMVEEVVGEILRKDRQKIWEIDDTVNEIKNNQIKSRPSYFNRVSFSSIVALPGDGVRMKSPSPLYLPVGAPEGAEVLVSNETSESITVSCIGSSVADQDSFSVTKGSTMLFIKEEDSNNWIARRWSENAISGFMKFNRL